MPDTNLLTSGVDTSLYPRYNPAAQGGGQAQTNPLAQVSNMLGVAGQAQGLQRQQFDLGAQKLHLLHDEMGALATIPGGPSYGQVVSRINTLMQSGAFSGDEVQRMLPNIPSDIGPDGNTARKQFFDQQLQLTGDYKARMANAYGAPGTANLGDIAQPTMTDPRTGVTRPTGPGMAIGMTPEAAGQPRPYMDPRTGQSFTVPASSVLSRTGRALPSPVSAPTNSDPNAPASSSMRPAGMPPQAGPQPQAGAAPAGALPQSLAAGQNQMIEASTGRLAADLDSAKNLQSDLLPIANARSAITALGPNGIGPGTADRQKVASALQSAGLGWLPGVDSDRIENMDEAGKYLVQAQQSRAAALKAGTDQQQNTTAAGSPNLKMSSTAALNVLNAMEGQRRMQQAQTFSVPHDQNYLSNAAKFASSQDPRAYYFDRMTDDQKSKTMASLGGQNTVAYKRFVASLRSAHDTGLMETGQ